MEGKGLEGGAILETLAILVGAVAWAERPRGRNNRTCHWKWLREAWVMGEPPWRQRSRTGWVAGELCLEVSCVGGSEGHSLGGEE
jgi:hypothetical protein